MSDVRKYTNKILEAVEEGILDRDTVILACLNYMSESDVEDMAHANEFFSDEDEDDSVDYDPAEKCVDDLINGNLTDAKEMAKILSNDDLRKHLDYHYEPAKASIALDYLRGRVDFQTFCDAEDE